MNKPMFKRYADKTPAAAHHVTAFASIVLFEPDETDRHNGAEIISALYNGKQYTNFHRHEIQYTPSGRAYIHKLHGRMYLDQFIRTNI